MEVVEADRGTRWCVHDGCYFACVTRLLAWGKRFAFHWENLKVIAYIGPFIGLGNNCLKARRCRFKWWPYKSSFNLHPWALTLGVSHIRIVDYLSINRFESLRRHILFLYRLSHRIAEGQTLGRRWEGEVMESFSKRWFDVVPVKHLSQTDVFLFPPWKLCG